MKNIHVNVSVSVIVPLYNSESTICAVLDSVYKQTRIDLIQEIIVIDDGSIDSSYKLVEKYSQGHPSPPIILIHTENRGVSAARNMGIRMARGIYIAFLDSDDLWLPHKIERQIQVMMENPEIGFLGTAYSDKPFRIGFRTINQLHNGTLKELCFKSFPVTPSVMIKRSVANSVGEFDENQKFTEDINYFQKFCVRKDYYYLPEKLVEIGFHKEYFGEKGLTSNIQGMHKGSVKNITELYNSGNLSLASYVFFRAYYELKFIRRKIIRYIYKIKVRNA